MHKERHKSNRSAFPAGKAFPAAVIKRSPSFAFCAGAPRGAMPKRNILIFAGMICSALLFPVSPAGAVTQWTPNPMQSADVVAESGNLAPLPTPLPLTNFRYPHVDADGTVTFIADDPVKFNSGDKRVPLAHGIYRYKADGGQIPLVVAGQTRIGNREAYPDYIRALQSDGIRFVFHSGTTDNQQVIGVITGDSVDFAVDTLTTRVKSSGRLLTDINYPSIQDSRLFFSGTDETGARGLYLLDLKTKPYQPVCLLSSTSLMPQSTDRFFAYFGSQGWIDGEQAVFLADFVPHPSSSFATKEDTGKGGTRGIYTLNLNRAPAQPAKVIDGSTPLPYDPEHFFTFIGSVIPRQGLLAICGGWTGLNGVYLHDGKELKVLADTQTEIPELFEGPFTSFNKWIANWPPWIVFRAYAKDGYQAVFAYQCEEDQLYLLCDNKQMLDGKKIASFEFSQYPFSNGSVALMIRFDNKESGIYLAQFKKGLTLHRGPEARASLP